MPLTYPGNADAVLQDLIITALGWGIAALQHASACEPELLRDFSCLSQALVKAICGQAEKRSAVLRSTLSPLRVFSSLVV